MKSLLYSLVIISLGTTASAQTIVKSVDKDGNIVYANAPTPDAVVTKEISIDPGPPEERIEDAKQRAKTITELANKAREERLEAEDKKTQEEAEAKQAVAEPKVIVIDNSDDYPYPGYGTYPPGHRPPSRPPKPPLQPKPPSIKPMPLP